MSNQVKTEIGIEAATRTFIKTHGLKAFAEAYYNLLGTKPKAMINKKNEELAIALGLGEFARDLPREIPKKQVRTVVGPKRFEDDRKALSAFFREQGDASLVQSAQQQMLAWHFASSNDYGTALTSGTRRVSVGWNVGAEIKGSEDFSSFTFGMVGCTALAAVANDGSFHLSHWDKVANPAQIKLFNEFQKRSANLEVFVIGHWAKDLAAAIKARHPKLPIYIHTKEKFLESNYTVRVARENGKVKFSHASTPLAGDYISSIHNGNYGRWFAHGRFCEIIPPEDTSFVKTTFQELEK